MLILETLRKLVNIKGATTLEEIADFAGLDKTYVLEVLDQNSKYVRKGDKGRILGDSIFYSAEKEADEKAVEEGKYYTKEAIYINGIRKMFLKIHNGSFEDLKTPVLGVLMIDGYGRYGQNDTYISTVTEKSRKVPRRVPGKNFLSNLLFGGDVEWVEEEYDNVQEFRFIFDDKIKEVEARGYLHKDEVRKLARDAVVRDDSVWQETEKEKASMKAT